MQAFSIVAKSRHSAVWCGSFTAPSVQEALAQAKKEKGAWAAKALGAPEKTLTWEVEADFL
jgi:hypothetical protein